MFQVNIKNIMKECMETNNMKVFVSGVNGQLGHDVINELKKRNIEYITSDIQEESKFDNYISLDITNENDVLEKITEICPNVIIHCAAWTNVDKAEEEDIKPIVYNINVNGTINIAKAAKIVDAKMVYISTDYVFNGKGNTPWVADCKDYAPICYYGETKLQGEKAVSELLDKYFIVRIAWVFGINGNNFVKTMIKVGATHDEVRVVNDQIGCPTYTFDLARLLVDMIETDKYGYYHVTNSEGYISWYDFTKEIYSQAHIKTKVIPVTTEEYGLSKANRPKNSRLDLSKIEKKGFKPLPSWKDALKRYLEVLEMDK